MTVDQTAIIIQTIATAFPNYKPQYDTEQLKDAIQLWSVMFKDDPYELVSIALRSYISGDNEFAPSIGQIRTLMRTVSNPDELSEAEAWNMVLKALKKSTYFAEEEFDKLPDEVQKSIGSPAYLRELALSNDVNLSVESSNFYRNYRTVKERKKQMDTLPKNLRDYITATNSVTQLVDKQKQASDEEREYYRKQVANVIERFHSDADGEEEEAEEVPLIRTTELSRVLGVEPQTEEEFNKSKEELLKQLEKLKGESA